MSATQDLQADTCTGSSNSSSRSSQPAPRDWCQPAALCAPLGDVPSNHLNDHEDEAEDAGDHQLPLHLHRATSTSTAGVSAGNGLVPITFTRRRFLVGELAAACMPRCCMLPADAPSCTHPKTLKPQLTRSTCLAACSLQQGITEDMAAVAGNGTSFVAPLCSSQQQQSAIHSCKGKPLPDAAVCMRALEAPASSAASDSSSGVLREGSWAAAVMPALFRSVGLRTLHHHRVGFD